MKKAIKQKIHDDGNELSYHVKHQNNVEQSPGNRIEREKVRQM